MRKYIHTPAEKNISHVILEKEIKEYLKKYLPEYMIPASIIILKKFPITNNGKVDRKKLLEQKNYFLSSQTTHLVKAKTPTERKLIEIYKNILHVKDIGIENDFFDMGGHSLLLTKLIFTLREEFNIDLPLRVGITETTVLKMAAVIDQYSNAHDITYSQYIDKINLQQECFLPDDIAIQIPRSKNATIQYILLTGSTGFLGAFLLQTLIKNTSTHIFCLIRAKNIKEAEKKLIANLTHYQLQSVYDKKRVRIVVGDLEKKYIGLSAKKFCLLAKKIDAIYHNAALVNFVYSYQAVSKSNVHGTKEILKFAITKKTKPIHFISTLSVFSKSDLQSTHILEEQISDHLPDNNGYVISKWICEKIIETARKRNIPVAIYRIGRISGDSKTGVCQLDDFFWRILKSSIEIKKLSTLRQNQFIDLSPVDFVSNAIVAISQQSESLGKNFHISNSNPAEPKVLLNALYKAGYFFETVSLDEWKLCLQNHVTDNHDISTESILSAIEWMNKENASPSYDLRNTISFLKKQSIRCHDVDEKLLNLYLNFFIRSHYFKPPIEQALSYV